MVVLLAFGAQAQTSPAETSLISAPNGLAAPLPSGASFVSNSSISFDGRYVVFESASPALVQSDTNNVSDVFVRDRLTNTTRRVSLASNGSQGNGDSGGASISANGCCVVFISKANNLVAGDTNGEADVFVRNLTTNSTRRVNVSSNGAQSAGLTEGTSISADGRYVAFTSSDNNLVSGDAGNTNDVFVRDRLTGTTELASLASDGTRRGNYNRGGTLSADGRLVAFYSSGLTPDGNPRNSSELYVRDRLLNTTTLVAPISENVAGGEAPPSFSADGRYIAFASRLGNHDVYVRDLTTLTTIRASVVPNGAPDANGSSFQPSISADGRYLAFSSRATNLVGGDENNSTDIFVRDLVANATMRVSIDSNGVRANDDSSFPSISGDGRFVVFQSFASNLVANDTNNGVDVFIHEVGSFAFDFWLESRVVPGGCRNVIGTVRLTDPAPPGGVVVTLSDTLTAASLPTTVKILAGAKSKNLTVRTVPVALDEKGFVNATVGGVTKGQDLRVRRIGVSSVTVTPSSIVGGYTASGAAVLECNAAPSPITVSFDSNNAAVAQAVPATLVVPVGLRSTSFDVTTNPVLTPSRARISASANGVRNYDVIKVQRAVSVTPDIIRFGSQPIHTTSAERIVTVKNLGAAPFSVLRIRLAGNTPDRFAQSNDCPATLDAGHSCSIRVTFAPTVVGYRSARLEISTSANIRYIAVPLAGYGI